MALQTPVITKENVTHPQRGLFRIVFRMVAADDVPALPGLDVLCSVNFKPGQNNIADKVDEVVAFFQEEIDNYESRIDILTSQELTDAVSSIQSGLVVT